MFCHKCGKELIEGSVFCNSCGHPVQIQGEATNAESTVPQNNITNTNTIVKRSKPWYKRWWIWVIAAVIVIIASVTIIEETVNEPPSLFQMAESVAPMKEFGFDATYGDLFDWLMNDQGIKLDQQQKDYNYLTFSGKVTGGDYPVSIVLAMDKISKDNPNPQIYPYAMTLNGIDVPDFNNPHGVIKDLFWAQYNKNDYKTFMDFVNWDNENAFGTFRSYLEGAQPTDKQNQVVQADSEQALEADTAPNTPVYNEDRLGNNYDASIISERSVGEIEDYITSYVRPLYSEVNNNLSNYTKSSSNGVTCWHDGKGYIKKIFSSGVNNYDFTREYYYDTDSGRIAFAFVYSGGTEYRLYFRTNQLVRFIPPNGQVTNNPTSEEALEMGIRVLSEAY